MAEYKSSEIVQDDQGTQYHIGLKSDEVSDKLILVGDPERARLIAGFFDKVKVERRNREFATFTGSYKNLELTVMATGIGCDNTEIAVIELCQLKFPLTIIRCGTCGALQPDIGIGDLVISQGALRLDNTTSFFVEPNFPAIASYEVSIALLKSAHELNVPYHYGITATAPGFYGAQGRHVPGFPLREEGLLDRLAKQGIKNLEMEAGALLTLSCFRGFNAGAVCAVFASRPKNKFIEPDKKKDAELKAVKTALRAFEILEVMEKQKGKDKLWLPEIKIQ
jgi:uridine phosphorylase